METFSIKINKMKTAKSFTCMAIARTLQDSIKNLDSPESLKNLRGLKKSQQALFNVFLVVDPLILSMILPLLLSNGRLVPDSYFSESTANGLLITYTSLLTISFYATFLHMAFIGIIGNLMYYLHSARDIMWYFTTFHKWLYILNITIPISQCPAIMAGGVGALVLRGPIQGSLALVVSSILSIFGLSLFFSTVKFFKIHIKESIESN